MSFYVAFVHRTFPTMLYSSNVEYAVYSSYAQHCFKIILNPVNIVSNIVGKFTTLVETMSYSNNQFTLLAG